MQMGVLEKVQYRDWDAPIVPVPKANGGIRIYRDYKVTVNPSLMVDQFPVPTTEDLFATLFDQWTNLLQIGFVTGISASATGSCFLKVIDYKYT